MKKKSLFLVLTIVIMLSLGTIPAFGVEEGKTSELIGLEEYSKTMTELYEKYGWNLEIVDASNYKPVTRDTFESILNEIEKDLVNAAISYNETVERLSELNEQNIISIDESSIPNKISIDESTIIAPLSMPIYKSLSGQRAFLNSSFPGGVTIKYNTMSVYDGSNGYFISVESPGTWYYTNGVNLDNITYSSQGWIISGDRSLVYANASGTINYIYTEPTTGVVLKSQQPFSILQSFTP